MANIFGRSAIAIAALAVFAAPGHAADGSAGADAAVVQPLQLVNTRDLNFGVLLTTGAAGSVSIDPNDDARATTGGVTAAGAGEHAAQFFSYGGPSQFVLVTRGPLPVLQRQGGGASMNVSQLSLNGPVFRFLSNAGVLDLRVGGTLQVGANQAPGEYEGDFRITVTYF